MWSLKWRLKCFIWVFLWVSFAHGGENITIPGFVRLSRKLFYLLNDQKLTVPDRYTFEVMNQGAVVPYVGNDFLSKFVYSGALPTLWNHHANIRLLSLPTSTFILNTVKYLPFLNPDIVYFDKRLYMSWRNTPNSIKVITLDRAAGFNISGNIELDILVLQSLNFSDPRIPTLDLNGEDPRLFTRDPRFGGSMSSSDKLYLVFCRRFRRKKPELGMAYVELLYHKSSIVIDDVVGLHFHVNETLYQDEKNWSPFFHGGHMMFIQSLSFSHMVLEPYFWKKEVTWDARTRIVGSTQIVNSPGLPRNSLCHLDYLSLLWPYGEIRGGSPAWRIGNQYLTIFHSSTDPKGDLLKTYTMGAYTFSTSPPFRLTACSRHPMVLPEFYSGLWTDLPLSYYHIDYVVFPMGYLLSSDEKYLYLFYGKQDNEAWMAKISVAGLLTSLRPVESL